SQYLLEDAGPLLDRHQATLLQSIESSSKLALQFIEDMLDLHAIESGRLTLRLQPTDVAKLACESVEIRRQLAANRNIALTLRTEGTIPMLDVDPRRIGQCISALLRNELGCLQPGGRVEVAIAKKDDQVSIVVSGEGNRPPTNGVKALLE